MNTPPAETKSTAATTGADGGSSSSSSNDNNKASSATTHDNLYLEAPTLTAAFSSTTTASASSLLTALSSDSAATTGPVPTSNVSAAGTSGNIKTAAAAVTIPGTKAATGTSSTAGARSKIDDDKRLHNMPKALATKCVESFIAWGHDHKGDPAAYQAFLKKNLPQYPGVDGEKVRLYMKNIAATYLERYLPARARGYDRDFLQWWEHRPGRGRPKKDVRVPAAYALPHHHGSGGSATAAAGTMGLLTAAQQQQHRQRQQQQAATAAAAARRRRARKPTKRFAVAANGAGGGGGAKTKGAGAGRRRSASSPSAAAGANARRTSSSMKKNNNLMGAMAGEMAEGEGFYGDEEDGDYYSRYDEDGDGSGDDEDSDDDDDEEEEEYTYYSSSSASTSTARRPHGRRVVTTSSGRVVRRPADPYMVAIREEATKRARIEAALAMMEMDGGGAGGGASAAYRAAFSSAQHHVGPPPQRHMRTPSPLPYLFSSKDSKAPYRSVYTGHAEQGEGGGAAGGSHLSSPHLGRLALRNESPVPLNDHEVTVILTDLRGAGANGGSGGNEKTDNNNNTTTTTNNNSNNNSNINHTNKNIINNTNNNVLDNCSKVSEYDDDKMDRKEAASSVVGHMGTSAMSPAAHFASIRSPRPPLPPQRMNAASSMARSPTSINMTYKKTMMAKTKKKKNTMMMMAEGSSSSSSSSSLSSVAPQLLPCPQALMGLASLHLAGGGQQIATAGQNNNNSHQQHEPSSSLPAVTVPIHRGIQQTLPPHPHNTQRFAMPRLSPPLPPSFHGPVAEQRQFPSSHRQPDVYPYSDPAAGSSSLPEQQQQQRQFSCSFSPAGATTAAGRGLAQPYSPDIASSARLMPDPSPSFRSSVSPPVGHLLLQQLQEPPLYHQYEHHPQAVSCQDPARRPYCPRPHYHHHHHHHQGGGDYNHNGQVLCPRRHEQQQQGPGECLNPNLPPNLPPPPSSRHHAASSSSGASGGRR